jgi:hypothetical protein
MKIVWMITGLLLAATTAFAAPKGMQCGHEAWNAASPTDDQTNAAKAIFAPVKQMYMDNKAAIMTDVAALKAAFATQPIVKSDVETAGKNLFTLVMPIQKAGLDAAIDSINLLSVDQRKAFDAAFKACRDKNHGGGDGMSGIDWETINNATSF